MFSDSVALWRQTDRVHVIGWPGRKPGGRVIIYRTGPGGNGPKTHRTAGKTVPWPGTGMVAWSGRKVHYVRCYGGNSFIAKSFSSAKVFRLAGYSLPKAILRDAIIFARLNFV